MRLLITFALLLAPLAPAAAGTRAMYRMQDGKQLLIEVADNGEARVQEPGSEDYGVLRADGFYMVSTLGSEQQVARIEDIAAAIDSVVPPLFKDIFTKAGQASLPANLRVEPLGDERIGELRGKAYAVYGLDETDRSKAEQFVASSDPKLAPVGRALEAFMNAAMVPSAVLIGPAVRDIIAQTRTIFALGTPLRAGQRFVLDGTETVPVPATRTALPATPRTREQIVAALREAMAPAENAPQRKTSPH